MISHDDCFFFARGDIPIFGSGSVCLFLCFDWQYFSMLYLKHKTSINLHKQNVINCYLRFIVKKFRILQKWPNIENRFLFWATLQPILIIDVLLLPE